MYDYFSKCAGFEEVNKQLKTTMKENELLKARVKVLQNKILQEPKEESSEEEDIEMAEWNEINKKSSYTLKFKYKVILK